MEAAPHKAAAVRPLTTHNENYQSKDELISDVPLWTSKGRKTS